MLDSAPRPGTRPQLICMQRTLRWWPGAAARSYRQELGIGASQHRQGHTSPPRVGVLLRSMAGLAVLKIGAAACWTSVPTVFSYIHDFEDWRAKGFIASSPVQGTESSSESVTEGEHR